MIPLLLETSLITFSDRSMLSEIVAGHVLFHFLTLIHTQKNILVLLVTISFLRLFDHKKLILFTFAFFVSVHTFMATQ